MNSDFERELERRIDRLIKVLPELPAPTSLSARVLRTIEQRIRVPWYRRDWHYWPVPLQLASLVVSLAMFGGLCFAGWQLQQMHGYDLLAQEFGSLLTSVGSIWNALLAVVGALVLVIKQLGTGILLGCLAALGLAWAMCLGIGTLCVRLAFVRR